VTQKRSYIRGRVTNAPFDEWPPSQVALYDAALNLFYERGYDASSVNDIVAEAGLTKGAFYHYFSSKEELLGVVVNRYLDLLTPSLVDIRDARLPATIALNRVFEELLKAVADYRTELSVFFEEWRHLPPQIATVTKKKRDHVEDVLHDILQRGVETGELRMSTSPRMAAFAIFGMCGWTQYWWDPKGPIDVSQLAALFSDMIASGVEARPRDRA
jgi:AcrR family transcriptional regulator